MTHHASIWLDKAAGPTARACSAVALHARRIHARKCYARSAPAPLLARRARICGRRVLLRPRCPARRGVLEAVHSAASRGQLHVLLQPAAAAFLIAAAARLAAARRARAGQPCKAVWRIVRKRLPQRSLRRRKSRLLRSLLLQPMQHDVASSEVPMAHIE